MKRSLTFFGLTALVFSLSVGTGHTADAKKITAETLLKTSQTVVEETIHYPGNGSVAEITSMMLTVPPGVETGIHLHEVPLYAYVVEGEITVKYDTGKVAVFKKGQAFMEAMKHWHNGTNTGKVPTKILTVYLGSAGLKNAVKK